MSYYRDRPEECPQCGCEQLKTVVSVDVYDGTEKQVPHMHEQDGPPGRQSVRLFCADCIFYLRISDDWAARLESEALSR